MLLLTDERMSEKEAEMLGPLQLAYAGDAVWEILIRQRLLFQKYNVHHMHTECIRHVNAAAQAAFMARLRDMLTPREAAVAQRGRNAHARHPSPRNQHPADYAEATAFEAVIGFLYLTDQMDRLREVINRILEEAD